MPSVLPLSAAIAARTSRVEIATGLALAPLYDPIRLAEDAATIDAISNGRFILGLGLGWLDWEFEALGKSLGGRAAALEEVLRVCREAWGEGLLSPEGVSVTPKSPRAGGPPIWIGAQAERAVRRAARLADGFLAGEPTTEDLQQAVAWIRNELAAAGGKEFAAFDVGGYWPVFVWDGDDAWEVVRPFLHYMDWKYEDATTAKGRLDARPFPPELDPETEASLREAIIIGTPEEVAGRIRELAAIADTERFTFVGRHYFPGMDRAIMRKATRLFAEEIIPQLR
jgi:alkanesulfonate monooxygenase SsuD/methylene tetrahydromethanopterin reductase-like flavin-dependent oxidoreductase (luciferase family)